MTVDSKLVLMLPTCHVSPYSVEIPTKSAGNTASNRKTHFLPLAQSPPTPYTKSKQDAAIVSLLSTSMHQSVPLNMGHRLFSASRPLDSPTTSSAATTVIFGSGDRRGMSLNPSFTLGGGPIGDNGRWTITHYVMEWRIAVVVLEACLCGTEALVFCVVLCFLKDMGGYL